MQVGTCASAGGLGRRADRPRTCAPRPEPPRRKPTCARTETEDLCGRRAVVSRTLVEQVRARAAAPSPAIARRHQRGLMFWMTSNLTTASVPCRRCRPHAKVPTFPVSRAAGAGAQLWPAAVPAAQRPAGMTPRRSATKSVRRNCPVVSSSTATTSKLLMELGASAASAPSRQRWKRTAPELHGDGHPPLSSKSAMPSSLVAVRSINIRARLGTTREPTTLREEAGVLGASVPPVTDRPRSAGRSSRQPSAGTAAWFSRAGSGPQRARAPHPMGAAGFAEAAGGSAAGLRAQKKATGAHGTSARKD